MGIKENRGIFSGNGKDNNCDIEDCTTFINKCARIEKLEMLNKVWFWLDGLNPPDCRTPFMETKQLPHETTSENLALIKVEMGIIEEAYNYWLSDNNLLEDSQELSFFGNIFKSLFLLESSNQSLLDDLLSSNLNKEGVIYSSPGVKSQKHCDGNLNASWLVSITLINNLNFYL